VGAVLLRQPPVRERAAGGQSAVCTAATGGGAQRLVR
jgi:hypothetical protein